MIQPAAFGFNPLTETFGSFSQQAPAVIHERALQEFDTMVNALLQHNINVLVAGDTATPPKPAAIFPANWLCTTGNGAVTVFPLLAPGRRPEKRDDILLALSQQFMVNDVLDLGEYETEGLFLEGTASMAMDHQNKIIYACLSAHTHKTLLQRFATYHGYRAIPFIAAAHGQNGISYTNHILGLGDRFALICEALIEDEFECIAVRQLLSTTGHSVIPVSIEQAQQFAASIMQLHDTNGNSVIVLSRQAFNSLTREQVTKLHSFGELLVVPVPTIESIGGSSVSSMMVPVFLSHK